MRTMVLAALLLVRAIPRLIGADDPGFRVDLETVMEHDDGRFLWYHPRPAAVARAGADRPAVVVTLQQHLGVSDHYSGLYVLTRPDPDGPWTGPVAVPELAWRHPSEGRTLAVADVTPGWHGPSRRLVAVGCEVPYNPRGQQLDDRPRQHQTAYAVHDPASGAWTGWRRLEMPADPRFDFCRSACAQWLVEPDGSLLLPVYFGPDTHRPWGVTVVAAGFDGDRMTYRRHGTELALDVQRGLAEPSITRWSGRYFLTLRNDEHGYVTRGTNGLDWAPIRRWTFDDGSDLGSHNTQQHWLAHGDALHLVYTRRGADNDHIPRNRAPLFIARVDPERLQVIRSTERILIPERGAELGNFGVAHIDARESWVTVSEGVWGEEARRRGARGATYVARIRWTQPNRLAPFP